MQQNKGFFITGTDTNVGKTWITLRLIRYLIKQGIHITPRKPIESGWNKKNIEQTDAWQLAQAANQLNQLDQICPFRFKAAISPPRAAQLEKHIITTQQIVKQCINNIEKNHYLMVEGAGGFYSPLTSDGLNADFAKALQLPIILVVNDQLGCINHTLLTCHAIKDSGLTCCAIILNKMTVNKESEMNNLADLQALTDIFVTRVNTRTEMKQLIQHLAIGNSSLTE